VVGLTSAVGGCVTRSNNDATMTGVTEEDPPAAEPDERGPAPRTPTTRERLLKVAFELLLEQGYRDTTVQAVARRAGLTIGAIYANFANRHHLLAEAALGAFEGGQVKADDVLRTGEASLHGLMQMLAFQMSMPASAEHRLLTEITGASMREMKEDSPILQHLHRLDDLARVYVARAQETGDIDPALSPEPLVNMIVSLILGSVTTKSLGLPQPAYEDASAVVLRVVAAFRPPPAEGGPGPPD
jgi:AcrR family transcriptional regulator